MLLQICLASPYRVICVAAQRQREPRFGLQLSTASTDAHLYLSQCAEGWCLVLTKFFVAAGTSSSGLDASLGPNGCRPRLTRCQQLQAQAGVQLDMAQPACSSGASTQYSSAVSQGSAVSSQRASQEAAGCQVQGGLKQLAAQVCEQNACQPTGSRGPRGVTLAAGL